MDIVNNSGGDIIITSFFAYWPDIPTAQKIDQLFISGTMVWNRSDPDSPSDIPTEGDWINSADPALKIPAATVKNLLIQFSNDLQPTGYEVHVVFDIGCQVTGTR
jgi:hypothetical protein